MPVEFWAAFYVDLTNHGLQRSAPSNPVDPIQPQMEASLEYNTNTDGEVPMRLWQAPSRVDCADGGE